ncbi:bollus pemphigoid antigen, putative [Entamoeba invadens IP1]|uniref:Bollus pemphigoid antigen, putative n=1 Tax=Entamoeba invadens IP1 TaxID=370355 RepID=A0A0A1U063_ENTIV|nr:bollus pemphigoid antigen, putative [Entamoeba invadens IP1]ELP87269.1 bollus pemphigoid antigen, putative [Entamoeba invadens IP1]|eukprot:XP_004254040.1 bollus pemphigoid antigen, putative [Entamoeba invadens IP1]
MSIILSNTGYRKGYSSPCLWILTKDNILFFKNEQSVKRKEKPFAGIPIKSIVSNSIKQETPSQFCLSIFESQQTTGLLGDYKTLSYWLQAINFVIQDLVQSRQELEFLLNSQVQSQNNDSTKNPFAPPPQQQQTRREAPTGITRKPPPTAVTAPTTSKDNSSHKPAAGKREPLILSDCPTESLNQKAMRQAVCVEFVTNVLGKTVKISDFSDGSLFTTLFEKLSGNKLQVKENASEMCDKIHNIGTVIATLLSLDNVLVSIDPMDIIRGNDAETVKLIMAFFEIFVLRKVTVMKQRGMDGLLVWVNAMLEGSGIQLEDFAQTFTDGKAFGVIIAKRRPDLLDAKFLSSGSASVNYSFVQKALNKCRCKIIPDEIFMDDPDESSVIMTLASMMICLG